MTTLHYGPATQGPTRRAIAVRLIQDAIDALTGHVTIPDPLDISPSAYADACQLLGVPHGTLLTKADLWQATSMRCPDLVG